jgi:hypothetical protein
MISIEFKGRLGNNIFQYSLVRIIAMLNNYEYGFSKDIWEKNGGNKIFDCNLGINYNNIENIYNEEPDIYDPNVLTIPDKTRLNGYFQNEKYYIDYKKYIIDILKLKPINMSEYDFNCCYIHFRGGDFKNISYTVKHDYYLEAINKMKEIKSDINFIVITDDIIEAKNIFSDDIKIINNSIEIDFNILYYCHYCIIPDSTFSWWATWLSIHIKECVIAPKYWDLRNSGKNIWSPNGIKINSNKIIYI